MPRASREGLAWDGNGLDLSPVWAREPSVEAIVKVCREQLQIEASAPCQVSFYAEGAFNKLYKVTTSQQHLLMRVSLPVCPRSKTLGEITTIRFLRRATHVPVPEVIAFDDSNNNEIGFEWILMELMPGAPAYKRWRALTTLQKVALVQRMAEFQAEIIQHGFSGIGTLTLGDGEHGQTERPGEMVSAMFFWGNHYDYDVARGPFRSSHDWLVSYLDIIVKDQTSAKEEAEDEDDEEDAMFALALARRLISLLPRIFAPLQDLPERSVVWHEDMSLSNILVDEQGCITAVIDWECVSALPMWTATSMPKFLEDSVRDKEPRREDYADESTKDTDTQDGDVGDELDNEGKDELYWIHLMEYETSQLRQSYYARMCQLRPGWDAEVQDGALKEDFAGAVMRCGQGYFLKRIAQWVDAIERGEFPRLIDILEAGLRP